MLNLAVAQKQKEPLQYSEMLLNQFSLEIRAFAYVETSKTSALTLSIYNKKEARDRAIAQSYQHHEDKDLTDLFTYKGALKCF